MNTTNATNIEVLHRSELPLGGFAGLKEHRIVQDRAAWGSQRSPGAWDGLGNFVYLADARFIPHGETGLHPHHEIDVISVLVEGRIAHGGSLEGGNVLAAPQVQVQSAGGEGFQHNEVNPGAEENRMIQLWVLPEHCGQPAGYRVFDPGLGEVTRVYGHGTQFASQTSIDIAMLRKTQETSFDGEFLAYLARGRAMANGMEINDGDLIRGIGLSLRAIEDVQMIIVQSAKNK